MKKIASFFAGIGGICYGFKQAGFDVVFANEFDKNACINYRHNHPETLLVEDDIKNIRTSDIPDFDVFTGGFPCQPYSLAGNKEGLADVRGTVFFDIIRILKEKKPESFLLENVKNIKSINKGRDFKIIIDHLQACGYNVKYEVLGGHTHGNIPQCRERMFIVGFLDEQKIKKFDFPNSIPLNKQTNEIIKRTEKKIEKYYYTPKSQYYKMIDQAIVNDNIYQMRRVYMRENKGGVCPTLTANMGGGGHNVPVIRDDYGIRKLTPKECLSFQGFPEEFETITSDVHSYKQAGNAVVVPLVKRIAKQILESLK
jgi:DNA (cytosine-5)-methyltransferase 1